MCLCYVRGYLVLCTCGCSLVCVFVVVRVAVCMCVAVYVCATCGTVVCMRVCDHPSTKLDSVMLFGCISFSSQRRYYILHLFCVCVCLGECLGVWRNNQCVLCIHRGANWATTQQRICTDHSSYTPDRTTNQQKPRANNNITINKHTNTYVTVKGEPNMISNKFSSSNTSP